MDKEPKTSKLTAIAFFAFSVLAVLCGIYLIIIGDYFIGIFGSISSAALAIFCFKNLKNVS